MYDPAHSLISIKLFTQLLGGVYFAAFGAFLFQIRGLLGENGILPIRNYLAWIKMRAGRRAYFFVPTLFWLNASNAALLALVTAGTICSLLLAFNIAPVLMLLLLYILYLSIVSAGQDFLSFGWELFLLETTVNALLINITPNLFVFISLNLLLFRFHFQGGIVKIFSCDPNWRNLTGCAFHYQTQPIPNMAAWYIHKFPLWFHKAATALMFIVEMAVPFLLFLPSEEARLFVFICIVGLQLMIYLTGNFSYLNHLTVALAVILVSDTYLTPFFNVPVVQSIPVLDVFVSLCGIILICLQLMVLYTHLYSKNPLFSRILSWIQPFHLACRYGIFAIMTTKRYEVVVEGSHDGEEWKEYGFYYKPSELNRRPRRISPYQPRIDWQIWFLPFSTFDEEEWFQNFLVHLLKATPEVLSLIRVNPFPEAPPRYVRALFYDYIFSDYVTKRRTGNWWVRALVGNYSPTLSLKLDVPVF